MRRGLFAGGMLIAAVITSACSGGDDGASGTDAAAPSVPSETSGSTSAPATSTTSGPATTSTVAVTTSTTVVPATTTTTPTTSSDPPAPTLEELEAEVVAAYGARFDGYWDCLRQPHDCEGDYLHTGSPSHAGMQATIQALIDRDRYVGAEDVGYFEIDAIMIDGDRAVVEACWWSTGVLYSSPIDPTEEPSPENPATVVNDTPGTAFLVDVFARDAQGRWLLSESTTLSEHPEEERCGA
ncbi:MAG: hypothetical protein WD225_03535 [Ilumatobacteraceae bacterium]